MKKRIVALLLAAMMLLPTGAMALGEEDWTNPYADLAGTDWCYEAVTTLNRRGILEDAPAFHGDSPETRGNVIAGLYRLNGADETAAECPFTDVDPGDVRYAAICWGAEQGIIQGVSATEFAPEAPITRQQVCAMVIRYAAGNGVELAAVREPAQFTDSLEVAGYARSYVTACQMSKLISGYPDNTFRPAGDISRKECAMILYRLLLAQEEPPAPGTALVATGKEDYSSLYDSYAPPPFQPLLEETAAVDASWFDKAVFIGDSVTLGLSLYCGDSLGKAQYLCAGSMSARNTLSGVILPTYGGKQVTVAQGVGLTGAKVAYVMLGMNNISFGVDTAASEMETLLLQIAEANPTVTIVVESVTPMAKSSNIRGATLNNTRINEYNAAMLELCRENGWYYLDVAQVMKDDNGDLTNSYCSDNGNMGIHMSTTGVSVWVDYLKTHVPPEKN